MALAVFRSEGRAPVRGVRASGLLLSFGVTLNACAPLSTLLAERFSRERSCQLDSVRVHSDGANAYVATGCGKHTAYVCPSLTDAGRCEERGALKRADRFELRLAR